MDQVTTSPAEDAELYSFGYRQQFTRSLRGFESFAVAFSFISITTGIFTTYAFALATGGTRSIWTWLIVVVGQALVALLYGALSSRIPLSGFSYQWASRLTRPHVGWWFGWTSFAFLTIVTVSVDYGLIQVAFQPLIGETYTPTSAALETLVVLAIQAAMIITSTRVTTRVNNAAVATEIIGIVGLTVALVIVAAIRGMGHWSNLTSTGPVPASGYYAYLGPFMLATLLGAYTIVGFESASNLAEETHEPHKVIPRAMVRAVLLSGAVGFVFLLVLAFATDKGAYSSSAPVAYIVGSVLGSVVQKIFLVFVVVSIFACGLVIMVTNGRLIFSMARDRRLPGHTFLSRVPRSTGGPSWATVLAATLGGIIVLVLLADTNALFTLFTASTIMPALLYAGTVLLYIATRRGHGRYGKWEWPIITGAVIWLAYELIVLIGPGVFRDAQYYVLGALGLGLVFYVIQLVTEPAAMRSAPEPEAE
jgi:amino acid transporter